MNKNVCVLAVVLVACAITASVGPVYRSPARDEAPREQAQQDSPEIAAIRKTADEFVEAFNKGDAKAVAAFWTREGEFTGPDGETIRGRDAIEKDYVEFFKSHPKAKISVHVESVRLLGRYTALEEGMLKLLLPGDKEPGASRYSVLHVRDEDGWRMASVREWVPDPASLVSVKDLDWLIGEWAAREGEMEVRTVYEWDADKAILRCRYTLKKDGKVTSSGTQFIAKNPAGGLRSWLVDSSGAVGDSLWSREEDRWVIEASGTLPDGSEVTAVNILIPLGKETFTWQSTERTAAGSPLPNTPPVKVTRVKADK
jgi:uncharacterized protein (TIGR02246 family)